MKRRIFSVALALCLCISSQTVAHASQEIPLPKEEGDVLPGEKISTVYVVTSYCSAGRKYGCGHGGTGHQ